MSDQHTFARGAIRSRDDVRAMFGRIVPRYEFMNQLMTGGRDRTWRHLAAREALRDRDALRSLVLDVATGTGDLAIALRRAGAHRVVGLDFAAPMLAAAARKARESGDNGHIGWVEGDVMALPFADGEFDAVTVAFGLRNMPSYVDALREMARVLQPGGTLVCLETTPLTAPLLREVFAWYFARIVPFIGGLLSGDPEAYAYLPASAEAFPDADTLGEMMFDAGFARVRYLRLGGGTVALHVATMPGGSR